MFASEPIRMTSPIAPDRLGAPDEDSLTTPLNTITLVNAAAFTVTAVTIPLWVVTPTSMPLFEAVTVDAGIAAMRSSAIYPIVFPPTVIDVALRDVAVKVAESAVRFVKEPVAAEIRF